MSRHILERIYERKCHYELCSGNRSARFVYVGQQEWKELRNMQASRHYTSQPNDGRRAEAFGLLVYQVDALAHLEVA